MAGLRVRVDPGDSDADAEEDERGLTGDQKRVRKCAVKRPVQAAKLSQTTVSAAVMLLARIGTGKAVCRTKFLETCSLLHQKGRQHLSTAVMDLSLRSLTLHR